MVSVTRQVLRHKARHGALLLLIKREREREREAETETEKWRDRVSETQREAQKDIHREKEGTHSEEQLPTGL